MKARLSAVAIAGSLAVAGAALLAATGPPGRPTEPGELSPVRKGLAVLSLVLFVLLFMPTPYTLY